MGKRKLMGNRKPNFKLPKNRIEYMDDIIDGIIDEIDKKHDHILFNAQSEKRGTTIEKLLSGRSTRWSKEQIKEYETLLYKTRGEIREGQDIIERVDKMLANKNNQQSDSAPSKISFQKAPATDLTSLLKFVFSKKTYELVFLQTISDARVEYFEALSANENWKAKWRHFQIYTHVLTAIFVWFGTSIVKRFSAFWKIL